MKFEERSRCKPVMDMRSLRNGLIGSVLFWIALLAVLKLFLSCTWQDPVLGKIELVFPPSCCQPRGGINPYITFDQGKRPQVGRPLWIRFVHRPGVQATERMWIVWSPRPPAAELPLRLDHLRLPGCQLAVNPDQVLEVHNGDEGMLARGDDAAILFSWTPPAWAAGMQVWAQLVVQAPDENHGGYLLSPAVSFLVGH